MNDRNQRERREQQNKVILFLAVVIMLALLIETMILALVSNRNSNRTSTVLLNQVINILQENEKSEQELIDSLKTEYIVRAQSVAYFLDANPSAEQDIFELLKLARMMNLDEIHLFNKEGVIYGGTEPKYFGIGMDDGEQIGYFKPMLTDRTLSMCQDVTPNTAEGKSMMYAITWDATGEKMIQVGIEPLRLLEKLENNKISAVVDRMPAYQGMNIYVADVNTGEIYGATDKNAEGKYLKDVGMAIEEEDFSKVEEKQFTINGYKTFCRFDRFNQYLVAVTSSTRTGVLTFFCALGIEFIYLLLASVVIYIAIDKFMKTEQEKNEQLSILVSMADIYYSMHLLDLETNTLKEYRAQNEVKEVVAKNYELDRTVKEVMLATTVPEYLDAALEFTDTHTLAERMRNRKCISGEFVGKRLGWFEMIFITIASYRDGRPSQVMCVTRSIDAAKKKEARLIEKSLTDGLTGLYNRYAYESDIIAYGNTPLEENFVYVSMDVNGLKVVNDSLGHAAGDELLLGACQCMKQCLGPYGRLYRTGGDEFVAFIFASEKELNKIQKDFEYTLAAWSGKQIHDLSVSCGYVTKRERYNDTVREMAELADKRMYDAKEFYYQSRGIDRKAQNTAQNAMCELYAKVLQINLTDDTYQIVKNSLDEVSDETEWFGNLSSWLKEIAYNGFVHPDDREEYLKKTDLTYLRSYFSENKGSLRFFYRRKRNDEYQRVLMEIIPTAEYTPENQKLFLYVKYMYG